MTKTNREQAIETLRAVVARFPGKDTEFYTEAAAGALKAFPCNLSPAQLRSIVIMPKFYGFGEPMKEGDK